MEDLGQVLGEKVEMVTAAWIRAVSQDSEIESAKQLAYEAVRDSLPQVLEELASLLSRDEDDDPDKLEDRSLHHGFVRAQQGYDTAEIVREYRLLRRVLLAALEPELLTGTPAELLRAVRVIDDLLDGIITLSIESYIEARLKELRQMQSQLTLTNQELTRLVQVQKDNLSFMAHELKTPLNSIIGHSSVLLQKQRRRMQADDSVTSLDQLERVLRNGRRLLQIINDMLEISRYSEGQIQLHLVPANVGNLIREIIEDGLEPLALEKELSLSVDVSNAPQLVMTDALRLQQLVTNLVSNAIRYTKAGSVIVVARQTTTDSWEISVADTGIGIEEDARSQIFDPYVRSNPDTQVVAGTGLGLAIVKGIVDLMGGTIQLTSEIGVGSTFTITLPLIQPE
jgi:signal transduction histidine kinase